MKETRCNPKISVIVPIYNADRYLEKCIGSIINQTYKNLEIILIDDGSTDQSSEIAELYAQEDSRIILKRQVNGGESAARNSGLKLATGEYIAFADCDDWIEPDMYESLVREAVKERADIVISGWYKDTEYQSNKIRNEKKVREKVFSGETLLRYLYERDSYREFAYMWDKLYKRELFYDEDGEMILFDMDLKLGGDVLCLGRVALRVKRAVYVDEAFYHYVQRKESGCHTEDISRRLDWLQAYIRLIAIFYEKRINEEIIDLLKRFLVYHSAVVADMAYNQKDQAALLYCKEIIVKYRQEYERLNMEKPERIEWLSKILGYKLKEGIDI